MPRLIIVLPPHLQCKLHQGLASASTYTATSPRRRVWDLEPVASVAGRSGEASIVYGYGCGSETVEEARPACGVRQGPSDERLLLSRSVATGPESPRRTPAVAATAATVPGTVKEYVFGEVKVSVLCGSPRRVSLPFVALCVCAPEGPKNSFIYLFFDMVYCDDGVVLIVSPVFRADRWQGCLLPGAVHSKPTHRRQ